MSTSSVELLREQLAHMTGLWERAYEREQRWKERAERLGYWEPADSELGDSVTQGRRDAANVAAQ